MAESDSKKTNEVATSLVPRLSAQLFFARSTAYFTTYEKKLGREPGNEASSYLNRPFSMKKSSVKTAGGVQVYCKCRMPELPGEQIIEC